MVDHEFVTHPGRVCITTISRSCYEAMVYFSGLIGPLDVYGSIRYRRRCLVGCWVTSDCEETG